MPRVEHSGHCAQLWVRHLVRHSVPSSAIENIHIFYLRSWTWKLFLKCPKDPSTTSARSAKRSYSSSQGYNIRWLLNSWIAIICQEIIKFQQNWCRKEVEHHILRSEFGEEEGKSRYQISHNYNWSEWPQGAWTNAFLKLCFMNMILFLMRVICTLCIQLKHKRDCFVESMLC